MQSEFQQPDFSWFAGDVAAQRRSIETVPGKKASWEEGFLERNCGQRGRVLAGGEPIHSTGVFNSPAGAQT